MNDRERRQERIRNIRADGTTRLEILLLILLLIIVVDDDTGIINYYI